MKDDDEVQSGTMFVDIGGNAVVVLTRDPDRPGHYLVLRSGKTESVHESRFTWWELSVP